MSVTIINPPGGSTPVTVPVPQRPNLLRNSGFWFAQCYAPGTATTLNTSSSTRRVVTADGWMVTVENNNVTYQRIDTTAAPETNFGGRYYGKYVKTTSAGKMTITQAIESVDFQHLRGQTIRLQVWLKANVAAQTWRFGLIQLTSAGTVDSIPAIGGTGTWISAYNGTGTDPTLQAGNNTAYVAPNSTNLDNCTLNGNAADCAVTTSWQRFGITVTIPTDCENIIFALWSNAQVAINDGISIGMASMTADVDIVTWTSRSISEELLRCQRYILKTFDVDTAPAQNAGIANTLQGITGKSGAVATALFMFWRFPVPLFRDGLTDTNVFPSLGITRYNPSAANTSTRNFTVGIDMGATASVIARRNAVIVQVTGVGGGGGSGVGDQCGLHLLIFGEL